MKRFLFLIAVLAITLLASTSLLMAQAGVPSVANLVNFQGKLTTPVGTPVPDGPHSFVFRIYDHPTLGGLQWMEGPVIIGTTGGLFTHQLGSSTALPYNLFQNNDSLYLEVEADGGIITPRTRLIASPYTQVANALEVRSTGGLGWPVDSVAVKTDADFHGLSTYGGDGQEQIRIWGPAYGEILLHDGDPTNDLNVVLSANLSAGGSLDLLGTSFVRLNAGTTGDGTALLPPSAINAIEMLNEPGLAASPVGPPVVAVGAVLGPIFAAATLVAPASGFAVIICEAQFNAIGPNNALPSSLTENGPTVATWSWDAGDVDGLMDQTQVRIITRPIPAAGAFTYNLLISQVPFNGAVTAGLPKVTVLYFPTVYGGFATPSPQHPNTEDGQVSGAFNAEAERAAAIAANQARIDSELAAMKAEMEALKQRMDANRQGKQQAVEPNR